MTIRKTRLNRGQILATAVEASGLNKADVARKAGYSRSSYYKHIADPQLSFAILMAYGKALHRDFTVEFPEMPHYTLVAEPGRPAKEVTLEEAVFERDQWRDKYYDLLDRYARIIEEKLRANPDAPL